MRRIVILLIAILMLPAVVFGSESEVRRKQTKSFSMKPGGNVIIETNDGYIRVNTWDKEEVEVIMHQRAWGRNRREAERLLDEIEIDIQQRRDMLIIRDITNRARHRNIGLFDLIRGDWDYGTTVDFEVSLPSPMDLELTADDGDITVDNIEGEISINVDDGDAILSSVQTQRIEVDVDDGDIELYEISPPGGLEKSILYISGDDGGVDLRRVQLETIDIVVDDGDVIFYDVDVQYLDVNMDDGDFEADVSIREPGRVRVDVDDGDVELRLPESISAFFDLFAYDGRIRTDFPLDVERDEGETWCRGRLGDGKTDIRVEVVDGYITIKKW